MLYLHFLGTYHITFGDNREPAIETAKAKALLAYLAVENTRPHRREQLAAMFWPDSGQKAAHQNLRQALYVLRQQLRPLESNQDTDDADGLFLTVTRQDASFNTDSEHWIDAVLFTELTRSTEKHLHRRLDACPQCIERLEAAADLYTGDFLSGLTVPDAEEFEAWRVAQQESLHTQALIAFDALASFYERRGEIEKARRYFARRLELEPWDEETHRRVMRLLARHGLRGAALQQFESCKRILEAELGVEPSVETLELAQQIHNNTLPTEPDPDLESPYKGLRAFGVTDAADYFGRESVIDNLQRILLTRSVVVIIGPSGSGKSSLLRAGLLPNLMAGGMAAPDEPARPRIDSTWAVIECRPGSEPFVSLAQAIAGSSFTRADATVLAAHLRADGTRVTDHITIPAGTRALLCIDQFEELYTLCPSIEVRRAFIDLIINTIRPDEAGRPSLSIIGTLRADFVSQALAYRPLADLLQTGGLILGAMDRNELRRAIQEPARNRGVTFEAGLVERLLDDVGEEPGNLPLLQFALSELWLHREGDKLTHDAYDTIGGVGGALANYADTIYGQLTPDEEILARRLFVQLVQPGDETGDTRRPTVRTELGEDTWRLARRLADLRLVVTGRNLNEESVELIHEALIRNWDRLGEWMDEDREFRRWQQRLRTNVEQWTASGRDPDALLRGLLLGEAEQWAGQRREELSEVEQAFIDASLAHRAAQRAADEEARQLELERAQTLATMEHQRAEAEHNRAELERGARRRLRLLTIGVAAALVLAIVAAVAAAVFGSIAQQSANDALARQLAAQSINLADDDTDLALLLSTEALTRLEVPEDRTSFLTNFPINGLLSRFFQGGSGDLQQIAVSPDGQEILAVDVSGSSYEASIWDDDTN
ncbi:MAG: tetratricopeptide repeat protein, partial [Caldilineaceae bacterium]|nr:tetratricopeptide repeat protein [Caldilineaceae bacterium]